MSGIRVNHGSRARAVDLVTWALISGVAGLVANALLVLFFALAQPWRDTTNGYFWLGTANDVVIVVQFAAFIPVAMALRDRLPATRPLRAATAAAVSAMGAVAVLQLLLIFGLLEFELQVLIVMAAFLAVFLWILVASRSGYRSAALPLIVARVGSLLGLAYPVSLLIILCGLLLPSGSIVQYVAVGLAGVLGLAAWLGLPVWPLMLARLVFNKEPIEGGEPQ